MIRLDVKGIPIIIASVGEKLARGTYTTPFVEGMVIVNGLDIRDALVITGHDYQKIDSAVPQEWARREQKDPQEWMWSYENNGAFGESLSLRRVRSEAVVVIMEELCRVLETALQVESASP